MSFIIGMPSGKMLLKPLLIFKRIVNLAPLTRARALVAQGVHIVVATPGRLKDMLHKKRMTLDICRRGPGILLSFATHPMLLSMH
jgi:hypothetical protein